MFCWFMVSFFSLFPCALDFDPGEEGTSGGVNIGGGMVGCGCALQFEERHQMLTGKNNHRMVRPTIISGVEHGVQLLGRLSFFNCMVFSRLHFFSRWDVGRVSWRRHASG